MKKYTILCLIVILAWIPLFMGAFRARGMIEIQPTYTTSPPCLWTNLGTITCSKTALTTLDYSAVVDIFGSKTVDWDIPDEAHNIELRFQTDADGDDHVLNIYLARGAEYTDGETEDSYITANTIILRGGTQVGPNSNVFCCTVDESADYGNIGASVESTGSNTIERYILTELRGYKKLLIIATSLHSSATLYVDGAIYSE